MNERFRQLADQAQIGLFEDKSFGWSVVAGTDQHLSKFAELIVRECAGIVENKIEVSRYVHEAELLRECSTTIKLHFGVKE